MCGNSVSDTNQNWNAALEPNVIGNSGDSVLFQVKITAHHLGFFEFG